MAGQNFAPLTLDDLSIWWPQYASATMCSMKSTLLWLLAVPLLLGTSVLSQSTLSAAQAAADPKSHLSPGSAGARPSNRASNVYPIEHGYVDAHGEMIYYEIIGHGPPLMIVHGGPGASHDYFLPYLLPLARQNKLVFIDERGSGRSQKLDEPSGYTVGNMVEDVEDVRRELGLGKISLLGTPMVESSLRRTRSSTNKT